MLLHHGDLVEPYGCDVNVKDCSWSAQNVLAGLVAFLGNSEDDLQ